MDRPTRIAELVSAATRLPLLAVPLFPVVGLASSGATGLLWSALCLFSTSGLSVAYLAYLVRAGRIADPKKISQGERAGALWVVVGLHSGGWATLTLLGAPPGLCAVLLSYALATLAFALLTPLLKVSLHAAGAAGALVCLTAVFGPWGLLSAPLLPLVWWARMKLGRHTRPELALGVLVGGGGTWLSFYLTG